MFRGGHCLPRLVVEGQELCTRQEKRDFPFLIYHFRAASCYLVDRVVEDPLNAIHEITRTTRIT
jgi:hypothetical protein